MDEQGMAQLLENLLWESDPTAWTRETTVRSIRSFEDAGVLTRDTGLVIRLGDRSEFYITIQKQYR